MIEMQYIGTTLLLLVNPWCILHQNKGITHPSYINYHLKEDTLLPAMFNLLYTYNSMNQQLFEKDLCNKITHYENYGQFSLQMEAIMCLPQN